MMSLTAEQRDLLAALTEDAGKAIDKTDPFSKKYAPNQVLAILAVKALADDASDFKDSVRAATTAGLPAYTRTGNILEANVNGALNDVGIGGVTTLAVGNRFLNMHGTGADRGLYKLVAIGGASAKWRAERTEDADVTGDLSAGSQVVVEEGTNAGITFVLTTANPIVLNTTSQTWTANPITEALVLAALAVSAADKDVGGGQVTNMAAGVAGGDAVNKTQLDVVQADATTGINDAATAQTGATQALADAAAAQGDATQALADAAAAQGDATQALADAAAALPKAIYAAQSVVVAVADDTPVVQVVDDSQFVGRPAGGNVGVLTATQARALTAAWEKSAGYAAAADRATSTNPAAFSAAFVNKYTIPANRLKVGSLIKVVASGQVFDGANGASLQLQLKLAGVLVGLQSPALDVVSGDPFLIEAWIVVTAIGAGGTFNGSARVSVGLDGIGTQKHTWGTTVGGVIDTTANEDVQVWVDWTAVADDDVDLHLLAVEVIG